MRDVCIITGGGSGMGLATAQYMPKEKILLLSSRTERKLLNAASELQALGYRVYTKTCDTANRQSVQELAAYAASLGPIKNVINSAGLSPNMANPETILRVNALGTVYVNEEFSKHMNAGSVIIDIASNSAYALPQFLASHKLYALAESNEEQFLKKLLSRCRLPKGDYAKSGLAYAFSKNFTVWYASKCAFAYGKKGIRVASLSPGLIATDMGNLEKEEGSACIPYTAEGRMGTADELGYAIATLADERNGYLADRKSVV